MTNREFFNAVKDNKVTAEVIAFAEQSIAKLDERNAKRVGKPSKKSIENEPIKAQILSFIADRNEPCTAMAIGEALNLSTYKVSGLCTRMLASGEIERIEVKIPKVGKRVAYKVVTK